ncbi:GNAT family N-acetyltransferase [Aneurinibacillus aneurinilyticus]|uniref:Acetyltransferase, GNAT family n=1 Tax=Aneurinibacillus aneurinilyticus ATCC 12856 TaxID=649747 RepID=U1X591_ANEAE|nr:GNAT family N-acetyltransferase [Aneurinibacillus aneurinilyticus]ERI09698.1 acetyltransferase, GNAT family [Aneurinibacillus aneurinilyticus ATCC 12856]MED0708409.1 GNAT family N-acetyltransferase [Aneurinibacillus aneurinilyticus]MED0722524.1 GNAT family N-acetyltransferase [Aneurinibacillus aneurinilyticus]MED0732457.1 GNAT family N-acetyltransferase [Aneurinibacillus aneurinilyticus]MED0741926.1 GNAT family N-acetyltransferase [Aneurinibacillus aneurinilyticus]
MEHKLESGTTITIQKGKPEDAEVYVVYLEKISEESDFLTFGAGELTVTAEEQREIIQRFLDASIDLCLLAKMEGEIVGNLTFRSGRRLRTAHTGEFGVSVRRKYQGLGIGGRLISCLLDWARETGRIRKINLRVRADHNSAIRLYRKFGFKEEGRLKREFCINGIFFDALTMGMNVEENGVIMDKKNGVLIYQSEEIRMRYTTRKDLDVVLSTEQSEENSRFIVPWSMEQHASALEDENMMHAVLESSDGTERVGYVIVSGLQNPNDSIELTRIVITEKGRGWGRKALQLIKEWAFEERKAQRLWLDVKEYNTRARHIYEAEGFIVEGILRNCLKTDGKYESLVLMSVLAHEYAAWRKKG